MKLSFLSLLVMMLGVGFGIGLTVTEVGLMPAGELPKNDPNAVYNDPRLPPLPPVGGPQPVAVVDTEKFDFGLMERGSSKSHTFRFTNEGEFPLELRKGDTTCKCTLSELGDTQIPPGGSVDVTLTWDAKQEQKRFRQTATIFTSDRKRQRIVLTIEGDIISTLMSHPPAFTLSSFLSSEQRKATVRVVASDPGGYKIVSHSFSNPESADFFDVQIEEPSGEVNASEPLSYMVSIITKPGLPAGSIQQNLILQTDLEAVPPLSIPIQGSVSGDISIVGRGWKEYGPDRGLLDMGNVPRHEGAKRPLKLFIRGPERGSITCRVGSITPDVLKVSLGDPRPINRGTVIEVPLEIEVPKDAPPMRHLGNRDQLGNNVDGPYVEVIIETNHPQTSKLHLFVKVAVGA